ncbi:glycoside hydrolase family 16 protein [Puniceicoccales bacterium CK1056]|uniref:Glycoside hydrolase family 16 protein n=1 Tax=Oceanipulchritudo coccoides TaxID=2706888 RepID=A0A6B2LXT9_9BACT|nr:family 16 glycosylhydrolase [Oceanipulchritudo coccoides]NDV61451.1 glycoside hydrolase family 16 protein [Oceanipulchritudo coccoides]
MLHHSLSRLLTLCIVHGLAVCATSFAEPVLIWSDEFEVDGLPDPEKWGYQDGLGYNRELQFYTRERMENTRVENGVLVIEAHKEDIPVNRFGLTAPYSSGRLFSQGRGEWQYGRFEIRAKLPIGRGTWAALWMFTAKHAYGRWPRSGEIDIMEHVGHEMDAVHGTAHMANASGAGGVGYTATIENVDTTFHDYAVEWSPSEIKWFVDGVEYYTYENPQTGWEDWPFDQPFYLILNLAVGGDWGGSQGIDPDIWPQRMEVDYVRVYDLGDTPSLNNDLDELPDAVDPDDDNDGLSDLEEANLKTNPYLSDTDGDGFTDKEEVDGGSHPKRSLSTLENRNELIFNTDFSTGISPWLMQTSLFSDTGEQIAILQSWRGASDISAYVDTTSGTNITFNHHEGTRSSARTSNLLFQDTELKPRIEGFFLDFSPGDIVHFQGTASSLRSDETVTTEAVIFVYDSNGAPLPASVSVAIDSVSGDFNLSTTLEAGPVSGVLTGFAIRTPKDSTGSITFSNLSATVEKVTTWANWTSTDGSNVDTGDWLGWIYIKEAPWIWSHALSTWIYLPEDHVTASGAWTYVAK